MHHRTVKNAGSALAQHVGHLLGTGPLLGRAQHQGTACAQGVDLSRQVIQAACAKHHALGLAHIHKVFHGFNPLARSSTLMMVA